MAEKNIDFVDAYLAALAKQHKAALMTEKKATGFLLHWYTLSYRTPRAFMAATRGSE